MDNTQKSRGLIPGGPSKRLRNDKNNQCHGYVFKKTLYAYWVPNSPRVSKIGREEESSRAEARPRPSWTFHMNVKLGATL